jgi:hypothetical protein
VSAQPTGELFNIGTLIRSLQLPAIEQSIADGFRTAGVSMGLTDLYGNRSALAVIRTIIPRQYGASFSCMSDYEEPRFEPEIMESRFGMALKTIRSRSNMAVGETIDDKWKIVKKRTLAEPTARTPFQGPRFGIYDYEVEPLGPADKPVPTPASGSTERPLLSFRKVRS